MIDPTHNKPWYRQTVLYQIYPLSWNDANGDGYGDLRGIINRFDYLNDGTAESLGVGAVWLSPIYLSPMADWGYDVADYRQIDPRFGTMADFDELIALAHSRGVKVMLDFVANHTSIEHAWFKDSRSTRTSTKRDWYIWADPEPDGSVPNNWLSRFGGSAWTLDEVTGQYYMHSFLPEQPDLNWRNPAVREAMLEVLRFWLDRGVDGFRADALVYLLKDDQLRNDPINPEYVEGKTDPADRHLQTYSAMTEGSGSVLGSFCEVLDESDGRYLVSEAYLNIPGLQRLYEACRAHPVHAPFNFNLMTLPWSASSYRRFIDEYEEALGPEDWPNYVLGNHDVSRLASRVGQRRSRLLALLQMTLRGLPVVYAGDELGLENGAHDSCQQRDPRGRVKPELCRDVARSPIPWTSDGGFTSGEPWLPYSTDRTQHNVEVEERDPSSTLELYRHLIHLRGATPALTEGGYRSVESNNDQVFVFVREAVHSRCYIVANFSKTRQTLHLGSIGFFIAGTHEVSGSGEQHHPGKLSLEPYEGRVYEIRSGER